MTATPSYAPLGSFGSAGTGNGEFNEPSDIAVEPGTGNVVVADGPGGRVQVFSPTATGGSYLATIGAGTLQTPTGVAIDPTTGAIYISDAGTNRIYRYTSDGRPTPTYTRDNTFISPASGTGAGQLGSFDGTMAVDPTSHDLIIADRANGRLVRVNSTGASVGTFLGAASNAGTFTFPDDVAVNAAGDIFVVNVTGDGNVSGTAAPSDVEEFDASGVSIATLIGPTSPTTVTIEPGTNRILVGDNNYYYTMPRQIQIYAPDLTLVGTASMPAPADPNAFINGPEWSDALAVAVDPGSSGRMYVARQTDSVLQYGGPSVTVMQLWPSPGVAADTAADVTRTTAHLVGRLDAGGKSTDLRYQVSLDGTTWVTAATQTGLTNNGEAAVSADVSGLRPNSDYTFRIVATNQFLSATSAPSGTFHTAEGAPGVSAERVTDLKTTSAALNGKVTPLGQQSAYHFEYGETADYGSRIPAGGDSPVGNSFDPKPVSAVVSGLRPGTTYHFRLVATNATGTTYGDDVSFTTVDAAAATRAYEQVSPVDKQGVVINTEGASAVTDDGTRAVYAGHNAAAGASSQGAPLAVKFVGLRGGGGWMAHPLDPPQIADSGEGGLTFVTTTLAFSDDGTAALVASNQVLAPGGVAGNGNLYRLDTGDGAYELVATGPETFYHAITGYNYFETLYGASSDFGTIAIKSGSQLLPDATPGVVNVYLWHRGGGLQLANVLPDGTAGVGGVDSTALRRTYMSADGKRIFFDEISGPQAGTYMREGTTTTPISVSHRAGDPATVHAGTLAGVSRDGRFVAFYSDPDLSSDAPSGVAGLYRYDTVDHVMNYITSSSDSLLAMSADGTSVAYVNGAGTMRVWRAGVTKQVKSTGFTFGNGMSISPNGRYISFATYDLSGADTPPHGNATRCADTVNTPYGGQCTEVYLFDYDNPGLTCVSCPADGSASTGHASSLTSDSGALVGSSENVVNDLGEVFFDTPTPLVAQDTNGTRDVYEYDGGDVSLISPGDTNYNARFQNATPDGRDVYFTTSEGLVGQDRDSEIDVYDARLGGGIASQQPTDAPAPCGGADCREPTPGPTSSPPAPSEVTKVEKPVVTARSKPKVSVGTVRFTGLAIHIQVRTSIRGRIRVSGAQVTAVTRTTSKPGTYTVVAKYTRKTRSARKARHRVKFTIKTSLTPPFGAAVSTTVHRTLGK